MRLWLILAGLNGAMAVGLDAYGWHALEADPFGREMFNFAVRYQVWHALAMVGAAWAVGQNLGPAATLAGWLFLVGIVLFSGTLYVLGLTGMVLVPGLAPIGGIFLIAGWLALAWAGFRAISKG